MSERFTGPIIEQAVPSWLESMGLSSDRVGAGDCPG